MYEEMYNMKHTPFLNNIPVDALYIDELEETIGRLQYAAQNLLFAVLTAGVGCGKTTAIRKFVSTLDDTKTKVLYISDSKLTPRWFYNGMLEQLGVEGKFYRGDAKKQLHQQLELIRGMHHKNVVTVVDEAHLLNKEMLEEIRFLLNYKMDSMNPLSLILVGQNELWQKLNLEYLMAVRQRIDLRCNLAPYDRSQTEKYIQCHLAYAGGNTEIFTDAAIDAIYDYSNGAARAINKACTQSLLTGAQLGKKLIDDRLVRQVIESEMS